MIAGGLVALLLFGSSSYYIGHRLYQIAGALLPAVVCKVLAGIFLAVSIMFPLRFLAAFIPGWKMVKYPVNWLSSYWMGIFLYLLLFFALADILLLIGRLTHILPSPLPHFVRLCSGVTALCLSVGMVGYGICQAGKLEIVTYEIPVSEKNTAEGLHIVLISDLHLGAVTSEERLETIVEKINQLKPDVVCLAGDIFDSDYGAIRNPEKAAKTLRRLNAAHGVYGCLGNHDAGASFAQMETFLEASNIRCLNEEYVNIDDRMILLGRVDSRPIGEQGEYVRWDTAALLESIETQLPVVVLDHNPENLPQYNNVADLVLCGHTHHGQIWPVNWFTAYGYTPADNDTPQMIITSGVGVWGMPMRIGSRCEIVSIKME